MISDPHWTRSDSSDDKGLRKEWPLFIECERGDLQKVKELCENGANVNQRNDEGLTCLMVPDFSFWRSKEAEAIFRYLVQQGLSVDAVTSNGRSALHFAVEEVNYYLVKLLISEGAKNFRDENGETPLFKAALRAPRCDVSNDIYHLLMNYVEDKKVKQDAVLLRAAVNYIRDPGNQSLNEFAMTLVAAHSSEQGSDDEEEVELNPAYDFLREARSSDEFDAARDLERFTSLQCFIVMERILTQRHPDIPGMLHGYFSYGACRNFHDPRNVALLRHVVFLDQKYAEPFSDTLFYVLRDVFEHVITWKNRFSSEGYEEIPPEVVELTKFLFDQTCCALEKAHREVMKNGARSWKCVRFVRLPVALFASIRHFGCEIDDKEKMKVVGFDVLRFVKASKLLHVPLFHLETFSRLPFLVPFFVQAGANINEKKVDGRTALAGHLYFCFKKAARTSDRWDLVRKLISCGARLFVRSHEDRQVFRLLRPGTMKRYSMSLGTTLNIRREAAHLPDASK
ncbi:unnamed protein product [Caenorhabditis auriculariae]|uniref:Uncharacterized protein n=1 Tax=Caenorhabditis auriculariae TaxID=2777116 RepID=A0A8S1GZP1_9PELO|nr:unnamed protein product [Caenorhabditis auriculariae]